MGLPLLPVQWPGFVQLQQMGLLGQQYLLRDFLWASQLLLLLTANFGLEGLDWHLLDLHSPLSTRPSLRTLERLSQQSLRLLLEQMVRFLTQAACLGSLQLTFDLLGGSNQIPAWALNCRYSDLLSLLLRQAASLHRYLQSQAR